MDGPAAVLDFTGVKAIGDVVFEDSLGLGLMIKIGVPGWDEVCCIPAGFSTCDFCPGVGTFPLALPELPVLIVA